MLSTMKRMGIRSTSTTGATCQHEPGMIFGGPIRQADNIRNTNTSSTTSPPPGRR